MEGGKFVEKGIPVIDLTRLEKLSSIINENKINTERYKQSRRQYFSDFFATYSSRIIPPFNKVRKSQYQNTVRYGFFFDHQQLLLQNTICPELFLTEDAEIKSAFVNNGKILNGKLTRRRVDLYDQKRGVEEKIVGLKLVRSSEEPRIGEEIYNAYSSIADYENNLEKQQAQKQVKKEEEWMLIRKGKKIKSNKSKN